MKHKIFSFILNLLPKKLGHKVLYYKHFHKKLNLNNPVGLNEKIHWLILNKYGINETKLTDKYLVKEYIESLNIKNLNIPKTYFKYDLNDIDLCNIEILPDKFVLKCNHGSGIVFICTNKKDFDFDEKISILKKELKKDYSREMLEYHYKKIKPLVLVEEYLDDNKNLQPIDYKFFCFDGYVDSVMVCCDRNIKNTRDFYDREWNHLDYTKKEKQSNKKIEKPDNLLEMFEIASKISCGFPFVRVDLYNINGKIYFGEMTFTPAAGLSKSYSNKGNKILGDKLKIN